MFILFGCNTSSHTRNYDISKDNNSYRVQTLSIKIKTPYTGNLFIKNNKLISYGVTYSVSIDEISTFIITNEEALISNGFNMINFFK